MAGNIICDSTHKSWNVRNALFDVVVGFAFEKFLDRSRTPNLTKQLEEDLGLYLREGWPEKYANNLGGSYRVVVLDQFSADELTEFRNALASSMAAYAAGDVPDDVAAVPASFGGLALLTGELIEVVDGCIVSKK
jgi:hypothetical protein